MKTPYFLIQQEIINNNIADFKTALLKYWKNSSLAYSVKTNSLPWILKYMLNNGALAEVVSDEEYQLAKRCGFVDSQIVFNGPIKGHDLFIKALENNAVVNIDSQKELEVLKKYKPNFSNNIGLRINVDTHIFDEEDVGYIDDGFRFGFCEENGALKESIDIISSVHKDCKIGIHLHCNSITRSINVYKSIASYAAEIIKKYDLEPSYIDIGGGFFGGMAGKPTAEEYICVITEELSKAVDINKTRLIIEPGSALVGSAVDLHTSVIDVKDTNRARIVTTDGSRIHIDSLWKKEKYFFSVKSDKPNVNKEKQIICGYTCMDFDRLMVLKDYRELFVGDEIIYHKVGAYSMTFGGPFIRYYPEVYIMNGDSIELVRKRMTVDEYYAVQSLED